MHYLFNERENAKNQNFVGVFVNLEGQKAQSIKMFRLLSCSRIMPARLKDVFGPVNYYQRPYLQNLGHHDISLAMKYANRASHDMHNVDKGPLGVTTLTIRNLWRGNSHST